MQKQKEKEEIYQAWLRGETVEQLARQYRHWRTTVECILREQVKASEARLVNLCLSTLAERDDLKKAVFSTEYQLRRHFQGEAEADRFMYEWHETHNALCAKALRLPGIPRFIYDKQGLPLDVVPYQRQQSETQATE